MPKYFPRDMSGAPSLSLFFSFHFFLPHGALDTGALSFRPLRASGTVAASYPDPHKESWAGKGMSFLESLSFLFR